MGLLLIHRKVVVITVVSILGVALLGRLQVQAESTDGSASDSIGFYNILKLPIQKSYLVGLRSDLSGENFCFGVLISPSHVLTAGCKQSTAKRYAVIGSLFDNGNDGKAETIAIKAYKEFSNNSTLSYRTVGIYELQNASKSKSIALPDSESVSLSEREAVTTFGWVQQTKQQLITERSLKAAPSSKCSSLKLWFKDSDDAPSRRLH